MARQTSFLFFPVPSPLEEPWQDTIDDFFATNDVHMFSAVTDRNLIITGGGTFNYDSAAEILSWTESIKLTNFVTGFFQEIPANSVTLREGEFLFCVQVRGVEDIRDVIVLDGQTARKLLDRPRGELHVDTVIAFQFMGRVIFSTGIILPPDTPFPILTDPFSFPLSFFDLFKFNQVPTQIDPRLFRTPDDYRPGTLQVYLDGLRMKPGDDYTEGPGDDEFTFCFDVDIPPTIVLTDYIKK